MKRKLVATVIVLVIIVFLGYFLISNSTSAGNRGVENGLGSPSVRAVVTLTVVGGSAFITGFGFRDVIGRAVAMRQRSRLRAAQQVKH